MGGHIGLHRLDDLIHDLRGLPYRQSADGEAVAVDFGDLLHVPDPQVLIGRSLVDAEQHLPGVHGIGQSIEPVVLRLAPLQPPERALTAGLGIIVLCRVLHALVEGHSDIRAQVGLDAHALLRAHKDPVTVQMTGEGDALLRDLPQAGQGKHLESAGIRENGAVPAHEPVQAAHLTHHIVAGTQVQMIGVGQLDLTAQVPQIEGI